MIAAAFTLAELMNGAPSSPAARQGKSGIQQNKWKWNLFCEWSCASSLCFSSLFDSFNSSQQTSRARQEVGYELPLLLLEWIKLSLLRWREKEIKNQWNQFMKGIEWNWRKKKGNGVEWTQRKAILFHQSIFVKLIEEKNAAASAREWNEMKGQGALAGRQRPPAVIDESLLKSMKARFLSFSSSLLK